MLLREQTSSSTVWGSSARGKKTNVKTMTMTAKPKSTARMRSEIFVILANMVWEFTLKCPYRFSSKIIRDANQAPPLYTKTEEGSRP
jgi:hypothetical protein